MASSVIHLNNSDKSAVIFEKEAYLPIVSMQLIFENSGSIEDGEKAGLAKVVAKLLGEGTKALGAVAFAEKLDAKAIHISAHTGTETFVFELSSLKEQFDEAVTAFQSLLKDPNFTQKSLDKVKKSVIGSLMQKENDFDYVASQALKSLLFKGTVLEHPSSGTVKSIESITLKDVKAFFASHIVKKRAIAVVGGDIAEDKAKKAVASLIDLLDEGSSVPLAKVAVRKSAKSETLHRDTKQAYIYFGAPFDLSVDSPDYYKARVALYILGTGGFGTRLMEEIRVKRGLAYSAYARMSINRSHHYLMGYLQTKLSSSDEALKIVKEEFERFVKEGVTQKELTAAKEFLLGSEPLRLETLSQRLSRTFMSYYKGLPLDSAQKELDAIEVLSLDDLNAFIKKHKEILELSVVTVTK